uniref:Uncharacterized protein n=1 Tax=Phalansterium sp. PJK-2012 TaxID=1267188 RepID=T1QDZ7_9EUKA|nr:hypothetical protein [Phalansterium sp. PJK-2012]
MDMELIKKLAFFSSLEGIFNLYIVVVFFCSYVIDSYNIENDKRKSYFKDFHRIPISPNRIVVCKEGDEKGYSSIDPLPPSLKQNNESDKYSYAFYTSYRFTFDSLTNAHIAKLKFYQNHVINYPMNVYSKAEGRFVNLNVCILIQWGDENSLLNRGIYFSIQPLENKIDSKIFIHSGFFADAPANIKHTRQLYAYGALAHIDSARFTIKKYRQEGPAEKWEDAKRLKKFAFEDILVFAEHFIELDRHCENYLLSSEFAMVDDAKIAPYLSTGLEAFEITIEDYFSIFIDPTRLHLIKKLTCFH